VKLERLRYVLYPRAGFAQGAFFRLPFWANRKVTKPKRANYRFVKKDLTKNIANYVNDQPNGKITSKNSYK